MSTSGPSRLSLNITALPIASSVLNPHGHCISCLPAPHQRHSHLGRPGPGHGVARGSCFPWRQSAHPCLPPTPAGAVGAEPLPWPPAGADSRFPVHVAGWGVSADSTFPGLQALEKPWPSGLPCFLPCHLRKPGAAGPAPGWAAEFSTFWYRC